MKTKSTQKALTRNILATAVASVLLTPCIAQAATNAWGCSNDYWQTAFCWSTGAIPTSSDDVTVSPVYSFLFGFYQNTTLNIDSGTSTAFANSLTVDSTNTATVTVQQTGGNLSVTTDEYVGYSGVGSYNQSAGTNTMTGTTNTAGALYLGYNSSGDGSYTLSGTGNLSADGEFIGYNGKGSFTQTGGTNTANGDSTWSGTLELGSEATGNGSYDLQGGSLSTQTGWIGQFGTGKFTQSGGTATFSQFLIVGNTSYTKNDGTIGHSTGSYDLSGTGTLSSPEEEIGNDGKGSFTQSSSTNTTNYLVVGYNPNGNGSYDLSAGSLSVTANAGNTGNTGNEVIGDYGTGHFTQSGGTHTVEHDLTLAYFGSGNGTYNLENGSLKTGSEFVGDIGMGTFTQSGGSNTTGTLGIAWNNGGTGTYNLVAGNLSAGNEDIAVGCSGCTGGSANGHFIQSGGTNNSGSGLDIGFSSGSNGSYDLSAGTLSGDGAFIGDGGTGTFTQSGGTSTFNSITLGYSAGSSGTYNLQGGTLTVYSLQRGSGSSYFNWTGGTLNYNNPLTVGSGNFFSNLTLSDGMTLHTYSLKVAADGSIYQYAGNDTVDSTMVNYGSYYLDGGTLAVSSSMYNGGTFSFGGGTITGNGTLTNDSAMSGYGTIAGSGGFTNNGLFTQGTGMLVLSNSGKNVNNANMDLAGGYRFVLNGANLNNYGTINMNGALVSGIGAVHNMIGGTVAGRGSITSAFSNAGTVAVSGGTLNISPAFTSSGVIEMTGATTTMLGGTISNSGTIQGAGNVGNNITNTGTIDAQGGTLNLSGTVTNQVGGTIRSSANTKILTVNGMAANAGLISMAGGTIDTNGHAQTNNGNITGYGVLATGGLTNNAKMTLSGGTATVNGAVTNATTGTINVSYTPAVFTGAVVNNGTIKTTSTTVTFAGGYTENGTYISDPSSNYFTNVTVNANGIWTGGVGDNFLISGNFINNSLQNTLWDTATASLSLNGSGTQDVYLAGADLGAKGIGYRNNFAWGNFSLAKGDSVNLFDGNSDPTAALYVGSFSLGGGLAQLNDITSNYNIYYNPKLNGYLKDQTYALNGTGFLIPVSAVPLPAAAWLLASGLLGLVAVARRKKA